jgi:hypothetical protein
LLSKEFGLLKLAQIRLSFPGLSLQVGSDSLEIDNLAGKLPASALVEGHVHPPISTRAKHTLRDDIVLLESLERYISNVSTPEPGFQNTYPHLKLLQLSEFVLFVGVGSLELDMNANSYPEDITITQKKAAFALTHSIVIPECPVH